MAAAYDTPPAPPALAAPAPARATELLAQLDQIKQLTQASARPAGVIGVSNAIAPRFGGSAVAFGSIEGSMPESLLTYRIRGATALQPDSTTNARFGMYDLRVMSGALGGEYTHVKSFAGKLDAAGDTLAGQATRIAGIYRNTISRELTTEYKLALTRYEQSVGPRVNANTWPALRLAPGVATAYSKTYSSGSAELEYQVRDVSAKAKLEHGADYTVVTGEAHIERAINAGVDLSARAGVHLGSANTPEPSQFLLGGQARGSAYAVSSATTPRGYHAGAELAGPLLTAGVRPVAGLSMSQGYMPGQPSVRLSSAELGVKYQQPGTGWGARLSYAKPLDKQATTGGKLLFSVVSTF